MGVDPWRIIVGIIVTDSWDYTYASTPSINGSETHTYALSLAQDKQFPS